MKLPFVSRKQHDETLRLLRELREERERNDGFWYAACMRSDEMNKRLLSALSGKINEVR